MVGVVTLSASSSRTMTPVSSSSALSAEYHQPIGEQMLVGGERRATVVGAGSKGLGEIELWMLPADYGGHVYIERDGGNGPIEADGGRVLIEGESGQVPAEGDDGQMPIEGDGGNNVVDDDDASSSISGNSRAASHAGLTAPQGDLGDGLDSLGHKQYTRSARQRISALIHRAKPTRRSKTRSSQLRDSSSSTDAPLSPELETFSPELETTPSAEEDHRMPQPALSIKNISGISYSVDQSTSLSAAESTAAWLMHRDWRKAPSDKPKATCICDRPDVRVWRWKGAIGPGGAAVDEYETECELPVSVESFFAMQTEVAQRKAWDLSTKHLDVLRVGGSTELCDLHGQAGDTQVLRWLLESPSWPLKDREYVLHRRVCRLTDPVSGQVLYVRIEQGDNSLAARRLCPTVAPRSVRCVDMRATQVSWRSVNQRGQPSVRIRTRYREDPMVPLPKWLVGMIIDKLLPRGIAALRRSAVEREKRLAAGPGVRSTRGSERLHVEPMVEPGLSYAYGSAADYSGPGWCADF